VNSTTATPVVRRVLASLLVVVVLASLTLATAGASPELQAADTPTPTSSGFSRPLIVLQSYWAVGKVHPGESFTLEFRLANVGDVKARNVVVTLSSGDFVPAGTGGVIAAGAIAEGANTGFTQKLVASSTLEKGAVGTLGMSVSYTDPSDEAYSESFTLAIPVAAASAPYSGPIPTATEQVRPQLVITDYSTDVETLRPGGEFVLTITTRNVGGAPARAVSLIVGGGTSSGSGEGTQEPGGVSGGSGSFETFAPLGTSNVQYLGDFDIGGSRDLEHRLIVNTTANPGAYPLKISFVYKDPGGAPYTDDQVITLLVYAPPVIEVSFYQPPEVFFVGQPGVLPLQVVNLDRKSTVLGRMQVSAEAGELSNNVLPIGLLDAGGYFTLDAMYIPAAAGPADLTVTVDYLDDFNKPQRITQVLSVEVMEAEEGMGGEEGGGGEVPIEPQPPEPETFWQKVVRFFRGLFGLDSGTDVPEIEPMIPEEGSSMSVPAPKG
jgi:hypothetical protein